jgi:hypothetical protein
MKLSVTIEGLDTLSRFEPDRLIARLRSEVERELQVAASARPPAPADHRAALDRALHRLGGSAR